MSEVDIELLNCFIDESSDLLIKWESICFELEEAPTEDNWNNLFRVAHNLKGTSRSVGLDAIGAFVHRVEDGITLAKQGKIFVNKEFIQALLKAQSILQTWTQDVKKDPSVVFDPTPFQPYEAILVTGGTGTTEVTAIQATEVKVVEAVVKEAPVPQATAPTVAQPKDKKVKANGAASQSTMDETIRVSARKLDQFIQMVGELSIQQNVLSHQNASSPATGDAAQQSHYQLRKITRDLYEKALSLRMQPVQPIFQRLERTVRDIASSIGKEVKVEVTGGEVELDKTVCEKIIEPLTHMVRNSVDHGLEPSDMRTAAGKPTAGTVSIRAIQESSSVSLIIQDDGRGLDEEKILKKAMERGLVKDSKSLSQSEIFALIFLPGFSTAEKVTDVSGRGVGMDVVMRAIDALKGQVNIGSEKGKGTKFSIKLPTSLSLIDALIVKLSDLDYAVPLDSIEEVIDVVEEAVSSTVEGGEAKRMISLRNRVVPLLRLDSYLKTQRSKGTATSCNKALIVRLGKNSVALQVDEIGEQQQIVVRQLDEKIGNVQGFSGGTILGSGDPGLIVDVEGIARKYFLMFHSKEEAA